MPVLGTVHWDRAGSACKSTRTATSRLSGANRRVRHGTHRVCARSRPASLNLALAPILTPRALPDRLAPGGLRTAGCAGQGYRAVTACGGEVTQRVDAAGQAGQHSSRTLRLYRGGL